MTDSALWAAGILAAAALGFAGLAHVRHDDAVRAELHRLRTSAEVDALCWETVRETNATLDRMACSCWPVEEVTP